MGETVSQRVFVDSGEVRSMVVILRSGEAATKNLALMPFARRDSSAPKAGPQNDILAHK
jgi:hypothetical protein